MNNNTPQFIPVNANSQVFKLDELEFVEWNRGSAPVYRKHFQCYCFDEDRGIYEVLITWSPYDLTWGGDEPIKSIKEYILSREGDGFSYWHYAAVRDSRGHGYPLPLLFENQAEIDLGVEEAYKLRQEVLEWAKSV